MGKDKHVVKSGGGWAVKSGGSVVSKHRTQKNAATSAIKSAKKEGADVVIHGRDGKIRSKDTYGKKDPLPPRDKEH
jgi:phosphoribosylcarboxyaminoimidazole (NCAIR) mutase